jgi:hypothetical protein
VVAAMASGDKYQHAKEWKIPVVTESWITDSVKAGYSLPFPDYAVKPQTKTSTPDRDTTRKLINFFASNSILNNSQDFNVQHTV